MAFNKVQNIKGTHRNISDESDDDLGKLLREQREGARQRDLGRSNVEYPKGSPAGKSGRGKPREVASCSEASYLAREEGELAATTQKGGILPNLAETGQGAGVKIAATQDSASKLGNHPKMWVEGRCLLDPSTTSSHNRKRTNIQIKKQCSGHRLSFQGRKEGLMMFSGSTTHRKKMMGWKKVSAVKKRENK